jgi:type VI secretion system protein ImpE
MQQAEELFKEGRLQEAVDAQLNFVKKNPGDHNARFFLSELAAMQGDWERVDRQLDVIVKAAQANMLALLVRQLVRAEILREQVIFEGRAPEVVVDLGDHGKLQVEACMEIRTEQFEAASAILEKIEATRTPINGSCNGKSIDVLIDMDDRLRGMAEVLTATGKYFWVPWDQIASIKFTKPERPMDLIWRKAEISIRNSIDGEVYMPARYPGAAKANREEQLSIATTWQELPSGINTGRGQRVLLTGDEAIEMMALEAIEVG